MRSADHEALRDLEEVHGEGFWSVFEDSTPGAAAWNELTGPQLGAAAVAVSRGLPGPAKARAEYEGVARAVADATSGKSWVPFDGAMAEGLAAIVELSGTTAAEVESLLVRLQSGPQSEDGEEVAGVQPSTWLASALALAGSLEGLSSEDDEPLTLRLPVPLTAPQWVAAMDPPLDVASKKTLRHLVADRADDEFSTYLAQQMSPEAIAEPVALAVEALAATQSAAALAPLSDPVRGQLGAATTISGPELELLSRVLAELITVEAINEEDLLALVQSGGLMHHLHAASGDMSAPAVALLGTIQLIQTPSFEGVQVLGNTQAGMTRLTALLGDVEDLPGAIDALVEAVGRLGGIAALAQVMHARGDDSPVLRTVFSRLLDSDPAAREAGFLINAFDLVGSAADQTGTHALSEFLEESGSASEVRQQLLGSDFDFDRAGLYATLQRASADAEFAEWCLGGLSQVGADSWEQSLKSDGDAISLLFLILETSGKVTLGPPYLDAFAALAEAAAHRNIRIQVSAEHWTAAMGVLTPDQKRLLADRVLDSLDESEDSATPAFFDRFAEVITDAQQVTSRPRFVDRLCRPLVDQLNERGLQWVASVLARAESDAVVASDSAASSDICERLHAHLAPEAAAGMPEPTESALRELASFFRVDVSKESYGTPTSESGGDEADEESAED